MKPKTGITDRKKRRALKIRPMTIDDLADVFHLGEKLFTLSTAPNLYRTWDEYEVIEFYTGDPEYCLAATVNKKVVGFLLATIIDKRHPHRKYGYLVWFGVDRNHRGIGVGTRMFEEFKNLMLEEGVQTLLVDSEADNHEALDFFKKQGFASPQDHIYLTLKLKKPSEPEKGKVNKNCQNIS